MANLTETSTWESGIYRIETTDAVIGGEDGISNKGIKQLANRTKYLYDRADDNDVAVSALDTRIDTLESSSTTLGTDLAILKRMKGSASLLKQAVISGKHSASGVPAFVRYDAGVSTTGYIYIDGSISEPLVLSFSGGYDENGPINYYAYDKFGSDAIIINNTNQYNVVAEWNATTGELTYSAYAYYVPTYSYVQPTPLGVGHIWYDLRNEVAKMYNGSAWVTKRLVILASYDSATIYFHPTIGVDAMTLFGKGPVPSGTIHTFAGTVANIPGGYLLSNGAAISRTAYAHLFAAIGTTYGSGDGSTTFNLPDLRGEFLRGLDNSRGVDTDSFTLLATTTNGSANVTNADTTGLVAGMSISGTGIPIGATILSITNSTTFVLSANATATANFVSLTVSKTRTLGSSQADQFKLHTHKYARLSNAVNSGSPTTAAISDWEGVGNVQSTDNPQPVGGAETRPRNIAMNFIIKY